MKSENPKPYKKGYVEKHAQAIFCYLVGHPIASFIHSVTNRTNKKKCPNRHYKVLRIIFNLYTSIYKKKYLPDSANILYDTICLVKFIYSLIRYFH